MVSVRFVEGGKLMFFLMSQLRITTSGKVTAPTGMTSRGSCEIVEYFKG